MSKRAEKSFERHPNAIYFLQISRSEFFNSHAWSRQSSFAARWKSVLIHICEFWKPWPSAFRNPLHREISTGRHLSVEARNQAKGTGCGIVHRGPA